MAVAGRKVFIAAAQLKARGIDAYRLVDVRYSLADTHWGRAEHVKRRPTNSVFADVDRDLSDHATPLDGRHPLPSVARFVQWCAASGIDGSKPVLAFDTEGGALGACRLWWMLTTLGAEAYVLNGGWGAYVAEGLATETGEPRRPDAVVPQFSETSWDKWIVNHELVAKAHQLGVPLVDARPAFRFNTTIRPQGLDTVPTHVLGAVSAPFPENLVADDPAKHMKPESVLRQQWDTVFAKAGGEVKDRVFMCASGVTACHNIATVVHLGHPMPRLYPSSWSQFGNLYKKDITQRVLEQHGVILAMHTNSLLLMNQPLAAADVNCRVLVDGTHVSAAALASHPAKPAVAVMRLQEHATVTLRSGVTMDVQIEPLTTAAKPPSSKL